MEVKVNVRLNGLEEKLEQLAPKLARRALRKGVKAVGDMWIAEMQGRVPVDTGNLRESIKAVISTKSRGKVASAKVAVGPSLDLKDPRRKTDDSSQQPGVYGMFVELGTSKMPARPYMRGTFDATKDKAVQLFAEVLRDELEDVVKD